MNSTRTRIKICGITRPEDAVCAADAGADAIGLVFYEPSVRAVTLAQARQIVAALPALVSVVGLFVNAAAADVHKVLEAVPLDLLQFHGDEHEAYCRSFSKPYMKALRVRPGLDIAQSMASFPGAAAILLDTWHQDLAGGSGQPFDWRLIPALPRSPRLVLAGGLDEQNVARAIKLSRPYAVDVSSGVESAPGIKSRTKIAAFVNAVNKVLLQ
ncbi:MAG: phosphoribosylanthranilate isomerase [Pseudomonadales bacterium]|nr:phosphoribosylanthranilate isomerase [Pseudomonadales bacterium]